MSGNAIRADVNSKYPQIGNAKKMCGLVQGEVNFVQKVLMKSRFIFQRCL